MDVRDNYIVFGKPKIDTAEIDEVIDSMRNAWLGTGPKAAQFEADFCAFNGAAYSVGLNSCTAGLHLACATLDLQPGDEIITSPLTFCATANSIIHAGGTPVIADIDLQTLTIDPAQIEAKITPRTKAIMPVHFAGLGCDMAAIMEIASHHGLAVIEDCAHAIETCIGGRSAGRFGNFGVFSFYATKNLVTGEGGMVVSDGAALADRIRTLSLHGLSLDAWSRFSADGYKHYDVTEAGFKYNMMDLQAAIGIHQLARIESNWQRRHHIWHRYLSELADTCLILPSDEWRPQSRHAYHLFPVQLPAASSPISRDEFITAMNQRKIGVGVHYRSLMAQTFYQKTFGWQPSDAPHAYTVGEEVVSLPLSTSLTDEELDYTIATIRDLLGVNGPTG